MQINELSSKPAKLHNYNSLADSVDLILQYQLMQPLTADNNERYPANTLTQ